MSAGVNPIIRFAVGRRVTMSMVVLGLVVLGWLSLQRLPLDFLPAFARTDVSVSAPYQSSSPEEVERAIVRPLEDSLGTIPGIERMSSQASAGGGNINLSFLAGTDMEVAAVEVRDRIDRVRRDLPADLERLYIRRFQSSDIPVLRSSLAASWSRERLYTGGVDTIQPRLERLEGVAQVNVSGVQRKELRIELIPSRLTAHRIDARALVQTLIASNLTRSGGFLREGSRRYLVRTVGELRSVDSLRRLPIGGGLRLQDVADVVYDFPRREEWSFLNGEPAVYISINKVSSANLLEVVERVKVAYAEVLALAEAEGLEIRNFHDASIDVTQGLSELASAGLFGGGLAVVFTFLFLRKVRTTLLISAAIPLAIVTTLVFVFFLRQSGLTDLSLNVMSLTGLMLAVGMLADNSIVVVESIFRHRQQLAEDAVTSALRGASAVALPIVASTATTVCVFVPLIFLSSGQGSFNRFIGDIGLMVILVNIASLLVALTVVPLAASFLLRGETTRRTPWLDRMTEHYGRLLQVTLRHRVAFAVVIAVLLLVSWRLYARIGRTFMPPSEGRQITLFVDAPWRAGSEERGRLYDQVYQLLDTRRGQWEIADITHQYRRGSSRSRSRGYGGSNRFELYLVPEDQAKKRTGAVVDEIRAALPVVAGVSFKLAQTEAGPPGAGSSGLQFEVLGDDMEILELLLPAVTARLESLPFLRDVDSSLESGDQEIRVGVNRERALQAGLSSAAVAGLVSSSLSTRNVSYVKTEEREIGVVVTYREEDRETLEQLRKMNVRTPGAGVPLGSLVTFDQERGARSIDREDRRAKVEVSATTAADTPSFALMGPVRQALSSVPLPEGYEWRFGRRFTDAERDAAGAVFALVFALALVYMIMAALFESFVQPFTIMFSVPFAMIGVGLVMRLAGQSRSSASDMGLVILAGIVVNNAIVLIDHINALRREGRSRQEAVVAGGRNRLRPILLTAITTILGLLPMVAPFVWPEVFGQAEGRAAYWAPVSLVILGGMTTSTLLTLLVTPVLYTLVDDGVALARRVLARASGPTGAPAVAGVTR